MQAVQDLAGVGGEGGEDFGAVAAHAEQAAGGFGVGLRFGVEDEVGGVPLRLPARGKVVAVAGGFGVVDHDHCGFEHFEEVVWPLQGRSSEAGGC